MQPERAAEIDEKSPKRTRWQHSPGSRAEADRLESVVGEQRENGSAVPCR